MRTLEERLQSKREDKDKEKEVSFIYIHLINISIINLLVFSVYPLCFHSSIIYKGEYCLSLCTAAKCGRTNQC